MNSTNTESFSLMFSIISFLISSFAGCYVFKNNKKITQKQMMVDFFKEIFFDIVITKLPNVLNQIRSDANGRYDSNWLDEFEQIIKDFKIKSRFYKYYDNKFYCVFNKKIEEINEYIGQLSNVYLTDESLDQTKETLTQLYNELYEILFKYYCR